MLGITIIIIVVGFIVAYYARGLWWVVAILKAWALNDMFNYRRGESALN